MSAPAIELARLLNEARRRLTDRRCSFTTCERCQLDEAFLQQCTTLLGPILPEGMRAEPAAAITRSKNKG